MAQQISIEDALAAFRKKCGDLIDANVLLEARAGMLERRVTELEQQLADTQQPTPAQQQYSPAPVTPDYEDLPPSQPK